MATIKLLGADDASAGSAVAAAYIAISKFTAVEDGTMTEFRIKISAAGNFKVALYADSSGSPGAMLNSVGSTALTGTGWKTIDFPSTSITNGVVYWLAYNSDTEEVIALNGTTTYYYKSWAYANALPDPAGTGYSDGGSQIILYAGWGNPAITTSTSSSTSTTSTSSSSSTSTTSTSTSTTSTSSSTSTTSTSTSISNSSSSSTSTSTTSTSSSTTTTSTSMTFGYMFEVEWR